MASLYCNYTSITCLHNVSFGQHLIRKEHLDGHSSNLNKLQNNLQKFLIHQMTDNVS
jgi:hypothetical protein